jgi:hypothetical protein
MDSKFIQKIETFFTMCEFKDSLTISFVRDDGIIVYTNFHNELDAKSIGALVGGVWQAASSLASFATSEDSMDFRFSYDTSSDGIIIFPLMHEKNQYFLCGIYKEETNPAVLKQRLKVLQGKLIEFIDKNCSASVIQKDQSEKNRAGYLFENLTDDEMDHLFSVTGN